MMKNYRKIFVIIIFILACSLIKCSPVNATEAGTTVNNAIKIELETEYSKIWTRDNDDSKLYNEFTLKNRGVITFNITKPIDSNGNLGGYKLYIYNSNGELEWQSKTENPENNLLESYSCKIGLNQGKYYMNIEPLFYITKGSVSAKYSLHFENDKYYEMESNDTKSTANQLQLNHMYSATYCEESHDTKYNDYFKVNLVKDEKYKIIIDNFYELYETTFLIDLIDTENVENSIRWDFKSLSENKMYYEYIAENTGTYYIKLHNAGGNDGIDYKIGVYYDNFIPIKSISLNKTSIYLAKGGSTTLNVNFNPSNTNDDKTIKWTSSDTSVATVTNGIIKGIIEGTATITATTEEGKTAKCNVSVSCLPFNDIKTTDWFYSAVKYTYESDMIKGANETEFKPNTKLSRGMLVTILWRMEGSPKVTTNTSFPDVKATEYYSTPVKWAASKGIVSGYSSGKFGPNDNITREQLSVILRKYAKYKGKNVSSLANISSYIDARKVSSFAKEGVQWAIAKGIISGKDNGTRIDPQGSASRAEAAAMITNYCTKIK